MNKEDNEKPAIKLEYIGLIIIIVFALFAYVTRDKIVYNLKDWESYATKIQHSHDGIKEIQYVDGNRTAIMIVVKLREEKSIDEIKQIFEEIKFYLDDKERLDYLNELHKQNSFSKLHGFYAIDVVFSWEDELMDYGEFNVMFYNGNVNFDALPTAFEDWRIRVNYRSYNYDDDIDY